jgi:hypothetical protein
MIQFDQEKNLQMADIQFPEGVIKANQYAIANMHAG